MQLARRYKDLLTGARVRERPLLAVPRLPSELELQARWFAGEFGRQFVTSDGRTVDIVQFGTWNREAGPDFRDAAVRFDGTNTVRGSIEFDLTDRSWETHGHATNTAFDDTVLHVFVHTGGDAFFSRTTSHRNVPQVRVDPATLRQSFDASVPLARAGRCHAPLNGLSEERVHSVLDAASQFRFERKANRLRQSIETHGRDQALYQEIATALGYKQNKLSFTLLAQRMPLSFLAANRSDVEALLFGVSGFLGSPDLGLFESKTRSYLRELWDRWWPYRDQLQRLVLSADTWQFSGARPLNHPQRRVGALAAIVRDWTVLSDRLAAADYKSVRRFFVELRHPFWNFHYTASSAAAPKEMALVGATRVTEIFANVIFPFLAATGSNVWEDYAKALAQLSNRPVETAATRLFGDDPRRKAFTRTAAHQQGLLQIYEDFCLQDETDCAECPFPEQMRRWH